MHTLLYSSDTRSDAHTFWAGCVGKGRCVLRAEFGVYPLPEDTYHFGVQLMLSENPILTNYEDVYIFFPVVNPFGTAVPYWEQDSE